MAIDVNNNGRNNLPFVMTGNPETVDDASPYAPGQIGSLFSRGSETFQYVKLDTGATAAAAVAPAANQVVYWKDRDDFLVTNDLAQSAASRNGVAGILRCAATAGYYVFIQKGGLCSVATAGSPAVGDIAVPNSGSAADVTPITAGTAPTYVQVGVYQTTATNSVATVDLKLTENV